MLGYILSFKSIITSGQSLKIFGQKLSSVAFVISIHWRKGHTINPFCNLALEHPCLAFGDQILF